MAKQSTQLTNRKLRSSYFITTISISLVLFLLGIIGMLVLNAGRLSSYVRENLGMMIMIKDDASSVEVRKIERLLLTSSMIKTVNYMTKEQAAEQLKKKLGEDFVEFLGHNPLLSSIEIRLYAEYATPEGMETVKNMVIDYPEVHEVHYQRDMVHLIAENVSRISLVLLAFSVLMLLVATTLINNTVRLMVYSKRFLIRTMQFVGATDGFIRRPFITQAIGQGLIGGLVANVFLAGVIYLSSRELSGVIGFDDVLTVSALFALVFFIGIMITTTSTLVSVNKYLNVRTSDLYV